MNMYLVVGKQGYLTENFTQTADTRSAKWWTMELRDLRAILKARRIKDVVILDRNGKPV